MEIERDYRRMCYILRLERNEVEKAFSNISEFDKLITKIGKVLWEINDNETISR